MSNGSWPPSCARTRSRSATSTPSVTPSGSRRRVRSCATRPGEPLYLVSQVQDISERKHQEAELRWQAERDSLTGSVNRHRFDQELARCRNLADRHGVASSVILLDLDELKAVNDTFGHGGGDEALRRVAEVLIAEVRVTDIAARYGGDEFAVVLPHTSRAVAARLADRLVSSSRRRADRRRRARVWISVSAGVADNAGGSNPSRPPTVISTRRSGPGRHLPTGRLPWQGSPRAFPRASCTVTIWGPGRRGPTQTEVVDELTSSGPCAT